MLRLLARIRRGNAAAGDRGSVAVFTVVFAIAVLFLTALIVDGGNAMNARERAADIAGQAARAAADDVNVPAVRAGAVGQGTAGQGGVPIDWSTACVYADRVVQGYGAGLTGSAVSSVSMTSCHSAGGGEAAVTVQVVTRPLIGGGVLGPFPESATGTATTECGNAVNEGEC